MMMKRIARSIVMRGLMRHGEACASKVVRTVPLCGSESGDARAAQSTVRTTLAVVST